MTTTLNAPIIIDQPGVYDGMSDETYHADPVPAGSLSSSGARKLLPPSCPALFKHERDHGRPPKRAFDFGHAAHRKVLGVGADIVEVDAANYRTKAAQEAQAAAYAEGKTPLLPHEVEQVDAMAAALRAHPFASALFQPGTGKPEQSLFWIDEQTGMWLRARYDWLPDWRGRRGQLIVPDYKSCASANPDELRRAIAKYGYHCQGAFYLDGAKALGLAGDIEPQFLLVCQEKEAPYLVTVVEPDTEALQVGRARNRRAIEIYRDCMAADVWPGYSNDVELISLPPWAARLDEEYL